MDQPWNSGHWTTSVRSWRTSGNEIGVLHFMELFPSAICIILYQPWRRNLKNYSTPKQLVDNALPIDQADSSPNHLYSHCARVGRMRYRYRDDRKPYGSGGGGGRDSRGGSGMTNGYSSSNSSSSRAYSGSSYSSNSYNSSSGGYGGSSGGAQVNGGTAYGGYAQPPPPPQPSMAYGTAYQQPQPGYNTAPAQGVYYVQPPPPAGAAPPPPPPPPTQ